jgi:hypothetical protein
MDSPQKRNDLLRREAAPANACRGTGGPAHRSRSRQATEAHAALEEAEWERLQRELARLRGQTLIRQV